MEIYYPPRENYPRRGNPTGCLWYDTSRHDNEVFNMQSKNGRIANLVYHTGPETKKEIMIWKLKKNNKPMSIISPKSGLSPEGSPEVRYHKSMVENRRTCEKGSRWAENEKGKELKTAKKMMMMYMNCREWNAHGGHVENIIRCDHPSCIPVGPFVSELWHFKYFPTWRPSAILNLKKINI